MGNLIELDGPLVAIVFDPLRRAARFLARLNVKRWQRFSARSCRIASAARDPVLRAGE